MRPWSPCLLAALVCACSHPVSQSPSIAPARETTGLVPFTEVTEAETREALSEGGSLPSRVVDSMMAILGRNSAGTRYEITREDLDSTFDRISADDRIVYRCWNGEAIAFELSPETQGENVVLTKDVRCTGSPESGFARCPHRRTGSQVSGSGRRIGRLPHLWFVRSSGVRTRRSDRLLGLPVSPAPRRSQRPRCESLGLVQPSQTLEVREAQPGTALLAAVRLEACVARAVSHRRLLGSPGRSLRALSHPPDPVPDLPVA
jgi:hypothetical protein